MAFGRSSPYHRFLAVTVILISRLATTGLAQSISTNTPIPPLQWINLTPHLQGSSPPPLKDVSIGYDDTTRTLLIFGGESQTGVPQDGTHLLNLNSLVWSTPQPPSGFEGSPDPRSAAIGGGDFAASYRSGHVVIGGLGSSGPLSDVWEYDYNNQFWAQVNVTSGGPARWGAAGGIDIRVPFDPSGNPSPNNTFYLAGGIDSSGLNALSDTWKLELSGTLSSNLRTSLVASWSHEPLGNSLPAMSGEGGTVISQQVIAVGGCSKTTNITTSCAQQSSYVLNIAKGSSVTPATCVAPRVGAAVAPNENGALSNFGSQVFVMLGLFNTSEWDDGNGFQSGEVDVLDVNAGSWARVLPAGDPGSNNDVTYPSPREGAIAFSYSSGLVGSSRSASSDTLVFGGRDASGNYLNELWLLRAYNGSVTSSGQKWSGFGNGNLQSGASANGAGVTVSYMSSCVSAISHPTASTTRSISSSSPTNTHSSSPSSSSTSPSSPALSLAQYDTSLSHKLLAPLSVVLLLPAIILYRWSLPSVIPTQASDHSIFLIFSSALTAIAAYGVGIGGLASSFTSISSVNTSNLSKRAVSSDNILKTAHGKAGLALFICLYGLVPVLFLLLIGWQRFFHSPSEEDEANPALEPLRANSTDTAEKLNSYRPPGTPGPQSDERSPPASPPPDASPRRRRFHSWGGPGLLPNFRGREPRMSTESATESETSGPHRAFEVVNRPQRSRHHSATGTLTLSSDVSHNHRMPVAPRSLGDLSWIERRRSVNAIGELDYALHQSNGRTVPPTPVPADMLSTQALMTGAPAVPQPQPVMPPMTEIFLHTLFHVLVLALCVLSLIALWNRAPKATFGVFLAWTLACYAVIIIMAWKGQPRDSALTVLLGRLRGDGQLHRANTATPSPSRPLSTVGTDQFPFPVDSRGPYLQQPPFRTAHEDDFYSNSHGAPLSSEDEPGSDEDEDLRQRRIEGEMDRRDVSIVTVPKRRLWITNPS
ncbi:hypothetical protein EW146_g1458 [Bondarzewia mesenterica]|uniref:Uncharacterized protein n=1 Tax=Bondarzewia mesenterica TaxID=1095465 RepID=A0A4S4M3R2_9AGAM|nr:hypothetical protein EW146_g1458 [Bondarzewia mesenterica]